MEREDAPSHRSRRPIPPSTYEILMMATGEDTQWATVRRSRAARKGGEGGEDVRGKE